MGDTQHQQPQASPFRSGRGSSSPSLFPASDAFSGSQPDVGSAASPFHRAPRPGAEKLLEGLNPQQHAAVLHMGSPLLIVAGAGSGKTAVLTRRIAYLLAARGVEPGEILAITFTNKAAAEMRERVAELVGPVAQYMWVSTFHSTCVRILRQHAAMVEGLNTNFSIYDADDTRQLIKAIAKDLGLTSKDHTPRAIATQISNWKNELISPQQAASMVGDLPLHGHSVEPIAAEIYGVYQQRLRAANAVDFDDLIMEVYQLLRDNEAIAEHYRRRFRHVLIDEYQDTNHAQYQLVSTLVGDNSSSIPPSELCVVGDADQSIYAFRGATIRNIEEFEEDYPHATTIVLEQNYRSTQKILDAANAVISHNPGRRDKNLWTDLGSGDPIVGWVADNEHDEARFIASEIDRLVDSRSGYSYSDMAIMYRTNSSSRPVEEVFIRAGIPYTVVGGTRFYERKEIRDIVAYLKVLDNPDDTVSVQRIINTPRRGIGDKAQDMVASYASSHNISFYQAVKKAAAGEIPAINTRAQKALWRFVELIDELTHTANTSIDDTTGLADLGEIVDAVITATGYRDQLAASNDPQDQSRLENLEELVSVAREYTNEQAVIIAYEEMDDARQERQAAERDINEDLTEQEQPAEQKQSAPQEAADTTQNLSAENLDPTALAAAEMNAEPGSLQAFLERISLVADADQIPDEGEGTVTLMTLHTAKGLEFPVVFVVGWEDGQFPHQRSLGDSVQLAEERRLAYVAITRARKKLYLTRAISRSSYGSASTFPPSRFLADIPSDLIDWKRTAPELSFGSGWGNSQPGYRGHSVTWGSRSGSQTHLGSAGYGSGSTAPKTTIPKAPPKDAPTLKLSAGDMVNHQKYGLGTVKEVSKVGAYDAAQIDFGGDKVMKIVIMPGQELLEKL